MDNTYGHYQLGQPSLYGHERPGFLTYTYWGGWVINLDQKLWPIRNGVLFPAFCYPHTRLGLSLTRAGLPQYQVSTNESLHDFLFKLVEEHAIPFTFRHLHQDTSGNVSLEELPLAEETLPFALNSGASDIGRVTRRGAGNVLICSEENVKHFRGVQHLYTFIPYRTDKVFCGYAGPLMEDRAIGVVEGNGVYNIYTHPNWRHYWRQILLK